MSASQPPALKLMRSATPASDHCSDITFRPTQTSRPFRSKAWERDYLIVACNVAAGDVRMTDAEKEAYFEKAGVLGVQAMLITGEGLYAGVDSGLPRKEEARAWLKRQSERCEAERLGRDASLAWWTKVGAGAAVAAAFLAALSWLLPLK